jgi:putative membrane protein insertion efficiency factor
MNRLLGIVASWLVRGYQLLISPFLPASCRFYPTCSEYSRVSYLRHGFLKGTWLTVTRILRCNPWNPGGYDPVPPLPGKRADTPATYQRLEEERDSAHG